MAGREDPNLPTFTLNLIKVSIRQDEVPLADFATGMNLGGSCAPGIGVATAVYDPKEIDWERDPDGYYADSSHIGTDTPPSQFERVQVLEEVPPPGDSARSAYFIQAVGDIAPGGVLGVTVPGGLDVINRSEQTVPADSWIWGAVDQSVVNPASGAIRIANGDNYKTPAQLTLVGDWTTGTTTVDLSGSTDLAGALTGLAAEVIAGPSLVDAAQQIADAINAADGGVVLATTNNTRVLITALAPENTVNISIFSVTV